MEVYFMAMDPWSAAAEAVGSITSSALGFASARRQEKFQERMSSSAHQREVNDLRKAGINPILTATGGSGASTPTGTMFTPENPLKGFAANLQNAKRVVNETQLAKEAIKTQATQQNLNSAAAQREHSTIQLNNQQTKGIDAQIQRDNSQTKINSAIAQGLQYDNVLKKLDADIYNTPIVGEGLRVLERLNPLSNSALGIFNLFKKHKSGGITINNNNRIPNIEPKSEITLPGKRR